MTTKFALFGARRANGPSPRVEGLGLPTSVESGKPVIRLIIPLVRNSIGRSPLRHGFLLIAIALAWLALSPVARAVSPPPDGDYPNGNTAEGAHALDSLTTGATNTAIGDFALQKNTTGSSNSAIGWGALSANTTGANNTATGSSALSDNLTGKAKRLPAP